VVTLIGVKWLDMLGVGQLLVNEDSREGSVPFERGSYICLPSESNGPNLLDELLNDFYMVLSVLKLITPMQLKTMTHSESVHLCAE
jgi:hypothetical protein